MTELEDLRAKVDKLEYVEIKNVKEEINQIKIDLNTNNLLTKQSIEANEKLSATMDTLKSTMVDLAQGIKDSNRVTCELADTVKDLNEKVNAVEDKVTDKIQEMNTIIDEVDEKGKVDFLLFMKQNWFPIMISLGGLAYVISQIINMNV